MSYDEHLISMAGGDGETVDQLAAIEARAQAAAEGPWEARNCGADCCVWVASAEDPDGQLAGVAGVANAEFIAHARTDVPALLALVWDQQRRLDAVNELVREAQEGAWDEGGKASIEREHTYGAAEKAKFANPYRAMTARGGE